MQSIRRFRRLSIDTGKDRIVDIRLAAMAVLIGAGDQHEPGRGTDNEFYFRQSIQSS